MLLWWSERIPYVSTPDAQGSLFYLGPYLNVLPILGAVLIFSPWIFGFAAGAPSQNAWITGIAIVILSIAALAAFAAWEEWLNLAAGVWAIASPWLLGFQGTTARTVHVVIGVLVAALAAAELWMRYQNPPRLTASG